MATATTQDRLAVKTPESAFIHVLQEEFEFSPRVSRELLSTAKEMLIGSVSSSAVEGKTNFGRSRVGYEKA